jgi:hypothetical protein
MPFANPPAGEWDPDKIQEDGMRFRFLVHNRDRFTAAQTFDLVKACRTSLPAARDVIDRVAQQMGQT